MWNVAAAEEEWKKMSTPPILARVCARNKFLGCACWFRLHLALHSNWLVKAQGWQNELLAALIGLYTNSSIQGALEVWIRHLRGRMCYAECRSRYFTPPAAMQNVAAVVWLRPWTILSCSAQSLWIQRSNVLCGMSQQILLLQQLCRMSQLLSDWGHEWLRVVQLGVCDLCRGQGIRMLLSWLCAMSCLGRNSLQLGNTTGWAPRSALHTIIPPLLKQCQSGNAVRVLRGSSMVHLSQGRL